MLKQIDPKEIFVDETYQREVKDSRLNSMGEWDQRLYRPLILSDRGAGADPRYAVVDGQHRLALYIRCGKRAPLECDVRKLTPADEASIFRRLALGTKSLTQGEAFKAGVAAGETESTKINRMLVKHGLTVGSVPGVKRIAAVSALLVTYRKGVLDQVLRVTSAYAQVADERAYDGVLMRALAHFFEEFPDAVPEELTKRISGTPPRQLRVRLSHVRKATGANEHENAVLFFMELYNARRPARTRLARKRAE